MAVSVLMVCLGNICRSPLAEAAFRHHAVRLGLDAVVDSAGTGGWHAGDPPDARAQEVARRLAGLDIGGLRARKVGQGDFASFDYLVAMDHDNLLNLQALQPAESMSRLSLLLDFMPGNEGKAVADPYYGNVSDFEHCWHQVDSATQSLVGHLLGLHGRR